MPRLRQFQSLFVLALLVCVMSLVTDRFFTLDNLSNILRLCSVNMCLSIGMTLVIVSGGIDLSVGSILAIVGAVTAGLIKHPLLLPGTEWQLEFTVFGAIFAGLLVGMMLGACNGLMITKVRIPPFIATLAMLSIARGLTMLWTQGYPISGLGPEFEILGAGYMLGIPMPVWISAALVAIFVVITKKTRFGRHVYAVGGNERTARLSGLNVDRVKLAIYTLAGGLAGVGGLIVTSRLNSAQPNAGMGDELDSVAAVVIGGTSLSGGRGTILGTVIGCLVIGVLNSGLVHLGVSPHWQLVVKGLVILLAVALDRMQVRET